MLNRLMAVATVGVALVAGSVVAASPMDDLEAMYPGVRARMQDGEILRLYGRPFSNGDSVEASTNAFVRNHAGVLGVASGDLVQMETADGFAFQPIMYNRAANDYKFFAVYYRQMFEGIPVHNGELTLLVRNEPGFPLVLAVNNLRDVGGYTLPDHEMGVNAIRTIQNGFPLDADSDPQKVIWVDDAGRPALAWVYISTTGQPGDPVSIGFDGTPRQGTYDRRLVVVDASTRQVIYTESLIRAVDVVGHVDGWATPGWLPDRDDNQPVLFALPKIRVEVLGGNRADTDYFGDFSIPHSGNTEVTVRSRMWGPSLTSGVSDEAEGEISIDLNVTPPGPANFEHNPVPRQYDTAEVNAMLHTSLIHSWQGDINPSFPGLGRSFLARVNIASSCNAYYDGGSINFYRRAGGCVNTAYSTVVYHEYGHKIVDDGASAPSGDYHEGMADTITQVISDQPITGEDFFENGGDIRSGENNRQYPCSGGSHSCGQVLSGSVWHTREELKITEPDDYVAILADLTVNSVLLHSGRIDPGITIDYLTLDDDDSSIENGTPHYDEINAGFSRHNMDAPTLQLFEFDYPYGLPEMLSPLEENRVRVLVSPLAADPEPGTGMLHYDDGSGWQEVAMEVVRDNVYDAVFPAVDCGATVAYYFSALATNGREGMDPLDAPLEAYSALTGVFTDVSFADDFESHTGWAVTYRDLSDGGWTRGVPINGHRGDPEADFDGSGQCYVTGNLEIGQDLDGGPAYLTSPVFDLTAGDGIVSYACWMYSSGGERDFLVVQVSNDDGNTWTTVEEIGHQGNEWVPRSFRVGDFVSATRKMRVRFSIADNPNDSHTEAGIDAFEVISVGCDDYTLLVGELRAGEDGQMGVQHATPGETTYFAYSISGSGSQWVPQLGVNLNLNNPQLAGTAVADGNGIAVLTIPIPGNARLRQVWFQAAESGRKTQVVSVWIL